MKKLTKHEKYLLASDQFFSAGYSLSEALAAGYSLSETRAAGYSLSEALAAGYSLSAARAAGYSLSAVLAAGYSLSEALAAGYSLSEALAAGYSLSEALAAGYSLSEALAAGYSLSAVLAAGYSLSAALDSLPKIDKPYSRLLADIKAKKRCHQQSTFGPDFVAGDNVCGTAMCTAGHLVNMAGRAGYSARAKFGWGLAAALIHEKAHPGWPCQNFGAIPQDWAMAYIEEMAKREAAEEKASKKK